MIRTRAELWKLIEHLGGATAEIGVAQGLFSEEILQWPRSGLHYMVDIWESRPDQKGDASQPQEWHSNNFMRIMARQIPRGHILKGDSVDMSRYVKDGELALCYIDADHSYEGVKRDLRAWFPKVKKGGIMAFHDFEAPEYGVKKAVAEFCTLKRLQVHLIPETKQEDAGGYFIC